MSQDDAHATGLASPVREDATPGETEATRSAPGAPGIEPRWTSSAKEGVGTARSAASPLWFTLSHGILNEIYYPRIDQACVRDGEFLVATPGGRFFEEKRDGRHEIASLAPPAPAFRVTVSDPEGEFEIAKRVVSDPLRPVLLQEVSFSAASGRSADYELMFLLAPHLRNQGGDNTAWVGSYKGRTVVYAEGRGTALAVVASTPVLHASVGFVGVSDPWQDMHRHGTSRWSWKRAEHGNTAIGLAPDLAGGGDVTIAIGFGANADEAAHHAVASLCEGVDASCSTFEAEWATWAAGIDIPPDDPLASTSASVLAVHEAKSFPGGFVASLSIPWGDAHGDEDTGGYHLVWPRDHCEVAGGLLALGDHAAARRAITFLAATQEADGHWAQNMWLDGSPLWTGVQMDETALPLLLVDLALEQGAIPGDDVGRWWPMVRRAAAFLARNGPVTNQDRWEEDGGYSPFTIAVEIAALVAAAEHADLAGEPAVGRFLRETASSWDANLERWCYVRDTELAREVGVEGYYVRISPPDTCESASAMDGWIPIKNRPPGEDTSPAREVVSPDVLALVRFGVRAFDDPRIADSLRVIDARLRTEFPYGPGWHRYDNDGYGEHDDGSPFDGRGKGRVWPLLTGERAHFAVAAGRLDEAATLARAMRAMTGPGGLLPEQIWDAPDIPERELFFGGPSGAARPLAWAHAEYLKLVRSIRDGVVFDTPRAMARWRPDPTPRVAWTPAHKVRSIPCGWSLRIEVPQHSMVHWSTTQGLWFHEPTVDTGLGIHYADLPTRALESGTAIRFRSNSIDPTGAPISILVDGPSHGL